MPLIDDYDPNDDADKMPAPAPRSTGGGGGGGAPAQVAPSRQQEQPFTPWARISGANADVSKREADKLQSGVQGQVADVTKRRDDAAAAQRNDINSNYVGYQPPPDTSAPVKKPGAFGQAGTWDKLSGRLPAAPEQPRKLQAQVPGAAAGLNRAAGNVKADRLNTPIGAQNLEAQLGGDAWGKLIGDTVGAQQSANALGSTEGVQGLLQRQAAQPLAQGGAFDAALLGGAGGQGFRDTAKQFGGNQLTDALGNANQAAQSAWSKLAGDASAGRGERDAAAAQQVQRDAETTAKRKEFDDKVAELRQQWPMPEQWSTQENMLKWFNDVDARSASNPGSAQNERQNQKAWAAQLGLSSPQALQEAIKRMSPEEFVLFSYGMVPSWLKPTQQPQGQFSGLSTGSVVNGQSAGTPKDKAEKLKILYDILQAIMGNNPVASAGSSVGRSTSGV